jgi:amino acid transporter
MPNSPTIQSDLKRDMNTFSLVMFGVGTILGAGIFVVIGEVIQEAGTFTPLSYLLAASIAITTGFSYAEIAARIPSAAGPIDYVEKAFNHRKLGSSAGALLIFVNTVSAATIATGFVRYLQVFIDIPTWVALLVLIVALSTVAILGIKHSAWFMSVTTLMGICTLLAVIYILRDGFVQAPSIIVEQLSNKSLFSSGLFGGALLAVYSFIGFGDMAQTAEEVKNVESTMPKAMLIAIGIVLFFYVSVSAALVGSPYLTEISKADAPLVKAVELAGWSVWPVGLASLFIIVNGALTQLISASRLLMDLARDQRGAPVFFAKIHPKTHTPLRATLALSFIILLLAIFIPLHSLALTTSIIILLVFALVNASLFQLKRQNQPKNAPNIPKWVPLLGSLLCLLACSTKVFFLIV